MSWLVDDEKIVGHVSEAAKKNCYALLWSYGEICCDCGCCSDDALKRARARLAYHEYELERNVNFSGWFEDDPELMAIQKRNVEANIKYDSERVEFYRNEVARLEGTK